MLLRFILTRRNIRNRVTVSGATSAEVDVVIEHTNALLDLTEKENLDFYVSLPSAFGLTTAADGFSIVRILATFEVG